MLANLPVKIILLICEYPESKDLGQLAWTTKRMMQIIKKHLPKALEREILFYQHFKITEQLKQLEWNACPRASTHLSPASMGYEQLTHFVVNNMFQSFSQYGRPCSKNDRFGALGASGGNMAFEATLAVFSSAFLNKSTLKQTTTTGWVRADEVLGAPR
ncbi:hypothetical protein WR25_19859 [Diploscapter pachys]|uniref:F-box domain-containing protein n=1 Tax=Diploscapter pachys TaxID=2018661 RepID=A0A2A2LGA8_9BILA|nr:hypothetical protein WR25_19859 [Diploscapter pachys]